MNGQETTVSFLLNAFTIEMLELADMEQGHTALHKAVQARNREIATMLVVRGANVLARDRDGQSVHELALCSGQPELAATLKRKCFRFRSSLFDFTVYNSFPRLFVASFLFLTCSGRKCNSLPIEVC